MSFDLVGRDTGGDVHDAEEAVDASVHLPAGMHLKWTWQYEHLERVQARASSR